ncbi:MAG TPA: PLP-dependent aminotransferase family protein [Rhizomicrobium sp.]
MPASKNGGRSRRSRPAQLIGLPEDGTLSLQEKLYQRLRELIRSGTFPRGSRLASSRALAASLGISRNSVTAAIDRLIADGWLESRRNSGVYVAYAGKLVAAGAPIALERVSVPFQLGWPTHVFPVQLWTRLQMRRWKDTPGRWLQQGERLGLPALRSAIAAYLTTSRGLPCHAAQIVVTTAIPAGVEFAVQALGLSGAEAWIEDPCCQTPLEGLRRTNVRLAPIPIDEHGIVVEAAKELAPDARIAVVGPSCQAPTGVALSESRREALIEWAEATGSWIFEDDFNYRVDPKRPLIPPLTAAGRGRSLYFNSFNSVLFPGLRIAYVVVPLDLISLFEAARGFEGEVSAPNQIVLADFIEAGHLDEHLRRLEASDAERRTALMAAVTQHLGDFALPRNNAGEYFICRLKSLPESAAVDSAAAAGIVVTPMSEYRTRSPTQQEIILGYSQHSPTAIEEAALALRPVLESVAQYRSRTG